MKKNEVLAFTSKWMELENINLSDISQAQMAKNCLFSQICGISTQNKCTNNIGCGSHTKERMCTGGIGKQKETYNLNVVEVLTVEE
jgi:hypothetical protein